MATRTIQITENALSHALKSLGYYNIQFKKHNGSIDVVADGIMRSIFVCVKVNVEASQIGKLPDAEVESIMNKATKAHKEPWIAYVKMDDDGKITEDIKWKNLLTQ